MTTKILIRAPNWLGDVVMMIPAIRAIKRRFSQSTITVLALEAFRTLLSVQPFIDDFIPVKSDKTFDRLRGFFSLAGELRRKNFDKGYLFTNSFSTAFEMFAGDVRERVGFDRYGRGALLTHPLRFEPENWDKKHHAQTYLYVAGVDGKSSETPEIVFSSEYASQAQDILKQENILPHPVIGLVPGAAYGPAKMWPEEYFSALIEKILGRFDGRILLFGTPAEQPMAQRLSRPFSGKVLDLTGKTHLGLLSAFLSNCDAVVCNDSGAAHLSAALGISTFVIFGSSNPEGTAPLGRAVRIFYAHADCSPCMKRACPLAKDRYHCLTAITPDAVFAAVDEVLKMKRAPKS